MNRYKAEEARKRREARMGLTRVEVQRLDREEAVEAEICELARKIHAERFPEEWDFLLDDNVDCSSRLKGVNPLSDKYIEKTNQRRLRQGLAPLSDSGLPPDNHSWKVAFSEAEALIRKRYR